MRAGRIPASCTLASLAFWSIVSVSPASAGERPGGYWPGWRGESRDGKSPDTGLLKSWPEGGPELLWKVTGIGEGYSGVAVAAGTVYITGSVDKTLKIFAYDMNGKPKWQAVHGPAWTGSLPGSRATLSIDGDRLYLLSGPGKATCYRTTDGEPVWTREMTEFGGKQMGFGYSESMLVLERFVVLSPGADTRVAALDKNTGETIWTSPGDGNGAHYSSAICAQRGEVSMLISANHGGIFGVSPEDGRVLWSNGFCAGNNANCPTPAYSDGYVFWANGYGKGGICLELSVDGQEVSAGEAWRTQEMICHHGGYVIHEGYVYGNHNNGWACLDLKTGEKKWFEKGVGKGAVCFADGMLYTFAESGGRMGLVTCTPDRFEQKGAFSVEGKQKSWAHPVVTGGRLYLRYWDNLYCFDVQAK